MKNTSLAVTLIGLSLVGAGCVSEATTPVAPANSQPTAAVQQQDVVVGGGITSAPAAEPVIDQALDAKTDAEWPTYVDPSGQYQFSHPSYTEVRASQDGSSFEIFTRQTPQVDGPPDVVGKFENGKADIKVWENLSVEYYDTLVMSFKKLK